ncbi:MAG: hypothetical protein ACREDH_05355 [Methylocella sp.]
MNAGSGLNLSILALGGNPGALRGDIELFANELQARASGTRRSAGMKREHVQSPHMPKQTSSRSQKLTTDAKTCLCKYVDFLKNIPYMPY